MTKLQEDIDALRSVIRYVGKSTWDSDLLDKAEQCHRLSSILEPLAKLSERDLDFLIADAEACAADDDDETPANLALAEALKAVRG